MNNVELKSRTKKFAIDIYLMCKEIDGNSLLRDYIRQLIRSSSSVGANYRAACRAKSTPDFIHKLKIVEEEADESAFFLELLHELSNQNKSKIEILLKEANELVAIIVASIRTAKANNLKS